MKCIIRKLKQQSISRTLLIFSVPGGRHKCFLFVMLVRDERKVEKHDSVCP
jgi:hypothetical protein